MNRTIIRRWLNEYLDGEIGLADKAEFEQIMLERPEVRREYKLLRRLGLLLGSLPEIAVHPYRFRQRVDAALDARNRVYFTPQRAFAAAMLVTLIVVALTFGLFMYQQQLLGNRGFVASPLPADVAAPGEVQYDLTLTVRTSPERFFDRLLLECDLDLLDRSVLEPFMLQAHIYEGAVCSREGGLTAVTFPAPLPKAVRAELTVGAVRQLAGLAEELSGKSAVISAEGRDGSSIDFEDFLQLHPSARSVSLYLQFD